MAKYSDFLYSDEQYGVGGAPAFTAPLTWVLLVNWSGSTWTNESDRLIDVNIRAGRERYLSSSGFEPVPSAKLTATLDNLDRRYDPRNESSPLYPDVRPGKKVELSARINATGVRHVIFTGNLSDVRPISGDSGGDVRFVCGGYDGVLEKTQTPTYVSVVNTSLSEAYNRLLDQLNFPGSRAIDTDTQPIPSFDAGRNKASSVADNLAAAGLGTFFVSKEGRACYLGRNFTARATHAITEAQISRKMIPSQPWDDVYNKTIVVANRPIKQLGAVIWSLPNPVEFTSGTPFTINILYSPATDIAIDATEANTLASGEGADITSSLSLTSFALSYGGGTMTFTPSASGYLTKLEIRGRSFDVVEEEYTYDDLTGQADGVMQFSLNTPYLQDPNYASVFADELGAYLKDYRDTLKISITARPDLQLPLDVMDKVELTADTLDLSGDYYVLGYEHNWHEATGAHMETHVWLRDVFTSDTAITPAPVEEIPAPIGFKNPAGDPTTIQTQSEGEDSVIFIPAACSLYMTKTKTSGYPITSETLTWGSSFSLLDRGMITLPGTTVVAVESGVYKLEVCGVVEAHLPYSGDDDAAGLTSFTAYTYVQVNGGAVANSYSNMVYRSRYAKISGMWVANVPLDTRLAYPLNAGDAITVQLNHTGITGTVTISYRVYFNMYKVRNL